MEAPLAITRADENGRETQLHGTTLFPVCCYYDDLAIEPTPWHWHDEFDAVTVIHGRAVVHVGASSFIVQAGDGFFINSGQLHAVDLDEDPECILHSISFHPRLVGGSIE
ncbi:MAG: AraC family ligand binding domain-containing protein, partial [Solobacterium sp.]|nr:AraC family ligand binding domain-containing protein [Solobacterium sp.]